MHRCMDWRRVAFDWNHVRAFLVTAETGSYSAAAKALGVAQPSVGRQVAALQRELGVTLVERAGRGLAVTPTGVSLLEHVRAMSAAAVEVSRVAAGQSVSLEGLVTITASDLLATYLLPPAIARLRARHPGIELDIVASDAVQDLRRREADLAIRNFRPTEPDLIARKLRDRVAHLYATPAYLRTLGRKLTPAALARAAFIGFNRTDGFRRDLAAMTGLAIEPANLPIACASLHVQWALVRAGAGIGIMMADVGDADPTVSRVPDLPPIPVPMYLVTHQDVRTSRRLRVVADAIAEELDRAG